MHETDTFFTYIDICHCVQVLIRFVPGKIRKGAGRVVMSYHSQRIPFFEPLTKLAT